MGEVQQNQEQKTSGSNSRSFLGRLAIWYIRRKVDGLPDKFHVTGKITTIEGVTRDNVTTIKQTKKYLDAISSVERTLIVVTRDAENPKHINNLLMHRHNAPGAVAARKVWEDSETFLLDAPSQENQLSLIDVLKQVNDVTERVRIVGMPYNDH